MIISYEVPSGEEGNTWIVQDTYTLGLITLCYMDEHYFIGDGLWNDDLVGNYDDYYYTCPTIQLHATQSDNFCL